jgi:serine/threonine protein kinase
MQASAVEQASAVDQATAVQQASALQQATAARHVIVAKMYRLIRKIGEGSFGKIFLARHKETNQEVAIKLVKQTSEAREENNELVIYSKIKDVKYIPSLYASGTEGQFNYLVMELLEQNLEQLLVSYGKNLLLPVVIHLGLQMLNIIENIHLKGVLHRDIKPENFLLKTNSQNISELYLIDFGLSGSFLDEGNKHIQMKTNERLIGTPRYMSVNTQQHITPSRRDDLESIGYILIYLHKGELPWQAQRVEQARKERVGHDEARQEKSFYLKQAFGWAYTNTIIGEFILFIQYCRNLKFTDEPNYEYLRNILTNLARIL